MGDETIAMLSQSWSSPRSEARRLFPRGTSTAQVVFAQMHTEQRDPTVAPSAGCVDVSCDAGRGGQWRATSIRSSSSMIPNLTERCAFTWRPKSVAAGRRPSDEALSCLRNAINPAYLLRADAETWVFRTTTTGLEGCADIPARYGTWLGKPTFPQAGQAIQNKFCTHQWATVHASPSPEDFLSLVFNVDVTSLAAYGMSVAEAPASLPTAEGEPLEGGRPTPLGVSGCDVCSKPEVLDNVLYSVFPPNDTHSYLIDVERRVPEDGKKPARIVFKLAPDLVAASATVGLKLTQVDALPYENGPVVYFSRLD